MGYTPTNMATLAIAFDGTVTSIGEGHSDRSGVSLGLVGTTFTVNEWFAGGPARPSPSTCRRLAEVTR
jgi:hypothetical protein